MTRPLLDGRHRWDVHRQTPNDLPVTCADCGGRLIRSADGIVWRHVVKGADHAPHVAGMVRR